MAITRTLPLDYINEVVTHDLVERIKADLRKRVMAQLEQEISPVIDEVARDLAIRVAEIRKPDGDVYLQLAVNGIRIPDRKVG